MRRMARSEAPTIVVLDRLVLLLMLSALAAILTAAMVMQYTFGEIPCPLCLLQRVAMLGCCFGLIQQLHAGESERGTERGSGISLVFALLLLVISVRQTLLDLFPRPGHSYIGSAVLGINMEVWSVFVAVALLLGFAIRFALFGAPRAAPDTDGSPMRRCARGLEIYVVIICAINFGSVVLQCGLGECHTFGYRLL
jgi:disulfide bond formation protein DsbB